MSATAACFGCALSRVFLCIIVQVIHDMEEHPACWSFHLERGISMSIQATPEVVRYYCHHDGPPHQLSVAAALPARPIGETVDGPCRVDNPRSGTGWIPPPASPLFGAIAICAVTTKNRGGGVSGCLRPTKYARKICACSQRKQSASRPRYVDQHYERKHPKVPRIYVIRHSTSGSRQFQGW